MTKIYNFLFLLFTFIFFNFSSAYSENIRNFPPDLLCEALNIKDCRKDFYSFVPQYDRYLKSNWQHKIIVLNKNLTSRKFENPLFYFVTEQRDAHAAGWGYHELRTTLNNCKDKIKDRRIDNSECVVVVKANEIEDPDFLRQVVDYRMLRSKLEFEGSNETSQKSATEKLRELKSLLDDGLISQDQYDEKSSTILDAY
tara:strand:+ start:117 stop:710 length:594 start_codon:yes stop_codon:yes gene_type:complete